ncbi:FAD-dependent monooxygenase [Dyella marensis]|jgi:2-polyprenyl-6-methoxyphenol hydroxylase-like FAD-dependent oxidoreductase|uniref:2-polyprenyl-6-methoxyphenol hydroxylase n=1 Tax=Dyella marensis TaxID=500610 RepID=A0A1I2J9G6_9GAMM|nr:MULTISPECIES: FAD-dependent monooxygenase [Dyella]SFF50483.1 2-polyprenyl-6-methoxyphenol hydroxylase [Dyella marensis]
MNSSGYQPRILIAGAGIGGLACALALHANGFRNVVLLESAPAIERVGVGINVQPAAVAELSLVGLGEDFERSGIRTSAIAYLDEAGRQHRSEPRGTAAGHRFPQYSLHRGDLQAMLLYAVRDRLGPESVIGGARVIAFHDWGSGVTVRLASALSTGVEEISGDILIGADGIHSNVRRQLHPGAMDVRSGGLQMFRGVTELPSFFDGETMIVANDPSKRRLIAYPISARHARQGRALVNWVCMIPDELLPPSPSTASLEPASPREIRAQYAGWSMGAFDLQALLAGSAKVMRQTMVDRPPLPWWGQGRVTLLGDAAHLMYPVGAHGGSQAIVDGFVLAETLAASASLVDALRDYETRRQPATGNIAQANRDRDAAERSLASTAGADKAAEIERITRTYNAVAEQSSRSG